MTVIRTYDTTVNWSGNLGGYSWERSAINISMPSGFTLFKVEAIARIHSSASPGYVYYYGTGSNQPYIYITSTTDATYTWSTNFDPTGNGSGYGVTSGGSATFFITRMIWYFSKTFPNVTQGNLIQDTDFTNVGLVGTEGMAIYNDNFTKGSVITASAWNSKTVNYVP